MLLKPPASAFALGLLLAASSLASGAGPEVLEEILKRETDGESVDRRSSLNSQPASNMHGWQAGMIKWQENWLAVEGLSEDQMDKEYETKRSELESNPNLHLVMAHWCIRNGLHDRARGHYFGVLTKNPDNHEARKYLGHILVGGQWVDQKVLASAQESVQQSLTQLEQWVPSVRRIVEGLHSKVPEKMAQALHDLDALDVDETLPALGLFAANIDDDLARPLIRKISESKSQTACEALVRIALEHRSSTVKQQTARALRSYPKHYYVPGLLSMLETEAQVSNHLVMYPNGNIGLETVITNELQDRKQARRAQRLVNVVAHFSSDRTVTQRTDASADVWYWSIMREVPISDPKYYHQVTVSNKSRPAESYSRATYVPVNVALTVARNLHEQGKQQERETAQQNRELQKRASNIFSLLRATTDVELDDQAESWWSWWKSHNERFEGEKPTSFAYSQQRERLVVSSHNYSSFEKSEAYDFGKMLIQRSCLVPGTLIQTATGLQPVESIKIGDLVLSQDVETAELTLKPVVLTTIRPPKDTYKIVTAYEVIEATGGHNWFVSGKGWVMTRDLKPEMRLHTATGTLAIDELIHNPQAQPTFNLVVDDFHTYFVGPHRVLSYDNTMLKPTLRQVPGFGLLADATH